MSWWNTSNFSDLASKALKNAQQKIDKALDISDQQNASSSTTETGGASSSSDKAKDSSKEKSSWGGWMGEATEGDTGNKSAWSFPWGGTAENESTESAESQPEYFVKEKTAEEIKAEVLKAAKERTKAKSKLFPQKVKSNSSADDLIKPNESVKSNVQDDVVKPVDTTKSLMSEKAPQSETTPDTKSTSSLLKSEDDIEKIKTEQEEEASVNQADKCKNVSHDIAPDSQTLTETESDSNKAELVEVSEADIPSQVVQSDNKTEAQSSESGFHNETGKCVESSDKILKTEEIILDSEVQSDRNESEKSEEVLKDKEQSSEKPKTEDKLDQVELIEKADTNNTQSEILEQKTEETDLKTESENVPVDLPEEVQEVTTDKLSDNVDKDNVNKDQMIRDLSSGDISSSVEFVYDKDIPTAGGSEEGLYLGQSSSDPEIIDFDKEKDGDDDDFDHEGTDIETKLDDKSSATSVIDKDLTANNLTLNETKVDKTNTEEKEAEYHVAEAEISDKIESEYLAKTESKISGRGVVDVISEDSLLIVQQEPGSTDITKSMCSSDSESSMNRLDSSLDTCASGDTIVDQFANAINKEETENIEIEKSITEDTADQGVFSELTVDVGCDNDSDVKQTELAHSHTETDQDNVSEPLVDFKADSEGSEGEGGLGRANISPAHSFVKCMLEDVTDEGKNGDDNSDSHSSIEKSEGSRSVYSNQESGDEVDTTTSSDIEIISMPTPNGENRQGSPLDPIPLRMALQKTTWRGSPTHRRTDSSDSSNASGGNSELSPGRECLDYEYQRSHLEHEGHKQDLPALSEEDDNPYHPQKLLKKLAEMSEVLQAREDKLLQLSKDNCDLMETNSILRNQLRQSEEAREAEMTDVNELTAEFTKRLTDSEKRLNTAIREKDTVKKQLQDAQGELAKRSGDVNLKEILAEKEEQIAGLLQEGEKLSKSQLQSNTIIKKLRQKEKDNDSTITSQKKKLDSQKEELDHLHKVLESKEDLEKKQADAIAQLTAAVKKQEQDMVKLKSDSEDAVEKARGLQVALDNSYKEMAELHRNSAALDSKAQEAALSAETHVREELKLTIEKQQQQHKWAVDSLNMQIEDHRLSMARMEKEYNRREDLLKQEISDLQKQLQEDEARNQELTQGVSLATRPLLRQIENLQSTYNVQSSTWEKVEKNLSDRLSESQNQLAIATEKERTANEQVMDLNSKVTTLEAQNSRFRQERSQMSAELEMLKTKVELSEDAKQSEAAQVEVFKQQMAQDIQELKKQKVMLETDLDIEKSKVEQEKKKILMLQDQLRDAERDLQRSKSRTPVRASPSPVSVSRQDSMVGSIHEQSFSAITQDELDRSFFQSSPNGNKHSLYEALRQSGAANLLENLQSQLKLREGEISHLQSEIRSLERTRESMAKELVDLSNQNDALEEKVKDMPLLEEQYKDLDQRYNALLQMYGEKVEEADELKLDLQDVKEMYKAQINHLLSQS